MRKVFVRSAYNFDPDSYSAENSFYSDAPSQTQQSFKEECDINTIVRRFGLTGEFPENVRVPQYADFEETFDFMSSMNVIRAAQESFDAMPASVRDRFAHDPARFVDFCNDADNYDEAVKLGIVTKRPVAPVDAPNPPSPTPTPTPAPNPAPAGS